MLRSSIKQLGKIKNIKSQCRVYCQFTIDKDVPSMTSADLQRQYGELIQQCKEELDGPQEILRVAPYGSIRLDSDNAHMQIYGTNFEQNPVDSLIDEQYFTKHDEDTSKTSSNVSFTSDPSNLESLGEIDSQYMSGGEMVGGITRTVPQGYDTSFLDMKAFSLSDCIAGKQEGNPVAGIEEMEKQAVQESMQNIYDKIENWKQDSQRKKQHYKKMVEKKAEEQAQKILEKAQPEPLEVPPEIDNAREAARTLRGTDANTRKKLAPFEVILGSVPPLHKLLKSEITNRILQSKIFENEDLVAFSKPYGMTTRPIKSKKHIYYLLDDFLPDLTKRCALKELHIVNLPDIFTTGVTIMAKSPETHARLVDLFKKNKVETTYIAIVKGFPRHMTGIIDVPIGECINKYDFMGVQPDVEGYTNAVRKSKKAITTYEVLSKSHGMSVLELKMNTQIKHQARVHCAEVLECPIMGDHKYDNHGDSRPQILPGEALDLLKASKPQGKKLPMFLHIQGMRIPMGKGSSVEIRTRPPLSFYNTFKALHLGKSRNRISKRALSVIFPKELEED